MSELIELDKLAKRQEKEGESLENNNFPEEHGAKAQENVDISYPKDTPEEAVSLLSSTQDAPNDRSQHAQESHVKVSIGPHTVTSQESSKRKGRMNEHMQWIVASLNETVAWKLKLWVVIALIFLVIFLLIILSLVLYSVLYEDQDDKFDRSLFTVPQYYSGMFKLVNQEFIVELLSPSSPQSQNLSAQLGNKLSDLYTSSPALGRYFSGAGVSSFSNGSITAHYWLKFLLPPEHDKLLRYTVSREMVFNVLRQHLYDQDPDPQDLLYIDPSSLQMEVGNSTLTS
ncbi:TPA-induced transmembrane protein isoform X2 [Arapaima gigas]